MTEDAGIIFVVENNADHIFLLEQAFRKAELPAQLKIARYGNEAILYLKGIGIYADRVTYPLPDVILLDLDLPDGSAFSVLGWIRQQRELRHVKVFAMSYGSQPHLVESAGKLGISGWFMKSDPSEIVKALDTFFHPERAQAAA